MFRLLILNNVPILEQLRLEEALLRTSHENWCLINSGSSPAIVMGISGKLDELLNKQLVLQDHIPVIKRFSGGGTVYVDSHTVFATLICNQETFGIPLQPKPLLKWSESYYSSVFPNFSLRENDYVWGDRKFGGNAQYIQKNRWLLHTSFLWNFSANKMSYLLLPKKRPEYRQNRSHTDFLCSLHTLFPKKEELISCLIQNAHQKLGAQPADIQDAMSHLKLPHRSSTVNISLDCEEPVPSSESL
jgi:lipoate---protein ligase